MESLFLHLLNMSITAGWLALAAILLRVFLKKAPRWISVALWGTVALRLLLPFSVESVLSLIPSAQPIPSDILVAQTPSVESGIPALNAVINPLLMESFSPNPIDSVTPLQVLTGVCCVVWILGMAVMGLYAAISTLRLRRRVREAAWLRENIWVCDKIDTPFILGLFRPRIYLPSQLSEEDTVFVLAHEKAHLKRLDHWWKPLGFLLLTVYWFHPLLWVAYLLLCRDIEVACDEKVLQAAGLEMKKPYSRALINCSVPRKTVSACPLAFGEVGVKGRVKSVLHYKKPVFWIVLVALISCAVLSVCFLTDPMSDSAKKTTLKNVEGLSLESHFEQTVNVLSGDGSAYSSIPSLPSRYLSLLGDLEIFSDAVSEDRSDDRFRDHSLVLQRQQDRLSTLDSNVKGMIVSFNSDFSRVWVSGTLERSTLTYKVVDPHAADALWTEIQTWAQTVSSNGGADRPENVTVTLNVNLSEMYPQYFNLPTEDGLTVYVWRFSEDIYQYGLMAGQAENHSVIDIWALEPVLLPHMKAIVLAYGLPKEKISVVAVQHPLSSYYYPIDDQYQSLMEDMFWSGNFDAYLQVDSVVGSVAFDITGDGVEEYVFLCPGPSTERKSYYIFFTETPASISSVNRYTVFYPEVETDFSFEVTEGGRYRLKGSHWAEGDVYYNLVLQDGYILCVRDGTVSPKRGE